MSTSTVSLEVLRRLAVRPTAEGLRASTRAAKASDIAAWHGVAAAMFWAGYASPGALEATYDLICGTWLDGEFDGDVDVDELSLATAPEVPLTDEFWAELDAAVAHADVGYDATTITVRSVLLGSKVHPLFGRLALDRAESHPGAVGAAVASTPGFISLDELREEPGGSLARELHDMWVDNDFDPEVLDRNAIRLADLPPALAYLNTRILQMHDVWHLMGGYDTTAIGEVAISAFQLAQFGHNYSAHFLPFALTLALRQSPEGAGLFMQFTAEAWRHGRSTPPLMAIDWESQWHRPIHDLRAEFGIEVFESVFPQNIIETLQQA